MTNSTAQRKLSFKMILGRHTPGVLPVVGVCLSLTLLWCASSCKTLFNRGQGPQTSFLKGEFDQIAPLPDSVAGRKRSSEKGRQGQVTADYTTAEKYEAIKAHYVGELARRGWKLFKEQSVLYEQRDYGGKHLFFCKDNYTADLQFAGHQQQQFGWTYSLSLSWGVYDTDCSKIGAAQ